MIVLTSSDVLEYLLWWRFVEKDGVRFWMAPVIQNPSSTPARLHKARTRPGGDALREVEVTRQDFAQLLTQKPFEIGGVPVRLADFTEAVEDAYPHGPPMDCYASYRSPHMSMGREERRLVLFSSWRRMTSLYKTEADLNVGSSRPAGWKSA